VARRFVFFLLLATFLPPFAGLPAAHEIIMGVGFFRRFTADLLAARLRFGAATARRLRGGFGFVRARCLGALRLARSARFLALRAGCLICFALILRRLFAIFRFPFPARAGF